MPKVRPAESAIARLVDDGSVRVTLKFMRRKLDAVTFALHEWPAEPVLGNIHWHRKVFAEKVLTEQIPEFANLPQVEDRIAVGDSDIDRWVARERWGELVVRAVEKLTGKVAA